jgi:hypothetical protein
MYPLAHTDDHKPLYIVFDRSSGEIIHIHSRFSAPENKYVEIPIDELKGTLAKNESIVKRLNGEDPANLDILYDPGAQGLEKARGLKVDVRERKVVSKPSLSLKAEKHELVGDGQDNTSVEIRAVGEDGKTDLGFDDTLKVSTTRGKLSARGGVVEMRQGKAEITLTSVDETVNQVQIVATSVKGAAVRGTTKVEFV